MTDPKTAHDALTEYATEIDDPDFTEQLRKFAVTQGWEDASAADIAAKLTI